MVRATSEGNIMNYELIPGESMDDAAARLGLPIVMDDGCDWGKATAAALVVGGGLVPRNGGYPPSTAYALVIPSTGNES